MIYTSDRLAAHLRKRGAQVIIENPIRVLASRNGNRINAHFDPATGRFAYGYSNVEFAETEYLTERKTLKGPVDDLDLPAPRS